MKQFYSYIFGILLLLFVGELIVDSLKSFTSTELSEEQSESDESENENENEEEKKSEDVKYFCDLFSNNSLEFILNTNKKTYFNFNLEKSIQNTFINQIYSPPEFN